MDAQHKRADPFDTLGKMSKRCGTARGIAHMLMENCDNLVALLRKSGADMDTIDVRLIIGSMERMRRDLEELSK
jgi:hypothetical protein